MIYNIKLDSIYKAVLVCDSSHVDPMGISAGAIFVNNIHVKLLDCIAGAQDL